METSAVKVQARGHLPLWMSPCTPWVLHPNHKKLSNFWPSCILYIEILHVQIMRKQECYFLIIYLNYISLRKFFAMLGYGTKIMCYHWRRVLSFPMFPHLNLGISLHPTLRIPLERKMTIWHLHSFTTTFLSQNFSCFPSDNFPYPFLAGRMSITSHPQFSEFSLCGWG